MLSASISPNEAERRAQELLLEFYRLFFTGLPVTIGGEIRTFPKLEKEQYLFNQASPPPGESHLHTVFTDLHSDEINDGLNAADHPQKLVRIQTVFSVFVRTQNPNSGFQSADFECRLIADAVKQIFECEHSTLAQSGVHHARVRRGPVPISTPGIQTRMLMVSATLQYRVAA